MTTLNEALVQIIQSTQGAVEKGIGFLSAQIPDVIQQLLLWKFVEALVYGAVGVLVLVFLGAMMYIVLKKPELIPADPIPEGARLYYEPSKKFVPTFWRDTDGDLMPTILIPSIMLLVGVPMSCSLLFQLVTALQIYVSPKVFLIEYASHLVK